MDKMSSFYILCSSPPFLSLSLALLFTGAGVNDVKRNKCEKDLSCRKLKEQLDALERETTAKLSEVARYNRDMQVRLSYTTPIHLTLTF